MHFLFSNWKMKDSESLPINHAGIVKQNSGKSVTVSISATSACSGCHAKGSCNMLGVEEKLVEINGSYNVSEGDIVTILMKQSLGYRALLFGYVLPFLLILVTLITMSSMNFSELSTGLVSLATLLPYYSILFVFRKKVNEKFTFSLKV